MSRRRILISLSRRLVAVAGGSLLALIAALMPPTAQAQCAQWDVSGIWTIEQSNGFTIATELQQNGRTVTGKAGYSHVSSGSRTLGVSIGGEPYSVAGTVNGSIDGDDFYVEITWQGGAQAVYRGRVGTQGRIDGTTYDKRKTTSTANWFSVQTMKCAPPPPPVPPPVRSSGKPRSQPPAAPAPKPPWIMAAPAVFPVPGVPTGFVILTWDAGPEHPNAKVWLGKQIVAQGAKGGLQITVVRGQRYSYTLGDADKGFAVVSFIAVGP